MGINSEGVYYVYAQDEGKDVKSADVIVILRQYGWVQVRIRGSHHQFHHPVLPGLVTVPHPRKDIKPGTLTQIWRQAGIKK
ncbi:Predicted RNA binding protein YcfA, dsRBD-like fold, HicA-like mRNA interferase family [Enterobacter sp. kpr-6]|nr:Predicted RNA binding protein YcfA, dsRBD-like fold, HicA-like mRNA interferase family [Enterobacter sp. kpr-6]